MRPVLGLLAAGLLVSACDGLVLVVSTGPTPIHPASFHDGGTIVIGVTATGTLTTHNSGVRYQVVPPRAGTLLVHVSWESSRGAVAMNLGGIPFTGGSGGRPPIAGRLPVQAGQPYPIEITDGDPSTADAMNLPFVVTTAME